MTLLSPFSPARWSRPLLGLLGLLALSGAAALPGCATHFIPNTDVEDTDENRDVIRFCENYRRALERKDAPYLLSVTSPRYYEDGGNVDPADDMDFEGLREWLEGRFQETKAIRYEIRYRRIAKGEQNRVLVIYTFTASWRIPGVKSEEWQRKISENRLELEPEGSGFKILAGM